MLFCSFTSDFIKSVNIILVHPIDKIKAFLILVSCAAPILAAAAVNEIDIRRTALLLLRYCVILFGEPQFQRSLDKTNIDLRLTISLVEKNQHLP